MFEFFIGFISGIVCTFALVRWAITGEQPVPQFVGYEGGSNE